MDRNPGFRAILPAPTSSPGSDRTRSTPGHSSDSGGSVGAARGGAESPHRHKQRRHVPAACASCRRRKVKCSAERPKCRQCLRLAVDCIYETVGSETVGEARQRRLGELQSRTNHYEELFNIIKTRPNSDVAAIVARIRQGAHVEDIVRIVKEGDILIELSVAPDTKLTYTFPFSQRMPSVLLTNPAIPYINSLISRGTMDNRHDAFPPPSFAHVPGTVGQLDIDLNTWNMYQTPYHSVELADPRIRSVKASRWTTVTSDDAVVQKLIQIYFIFEFPYYTFLHKDYFLEDMVEGRERYCSSLLVNAMLAQACRGHQGLPQRFSFWEPQTLRSRFLAEARRLWDIESSQARITTIQAAAIMALSSAMDTLDVVCERYLREAIAMGQSLGLFDSYVTIQSRRRRHVYTITAWGLYGVQGIIGFHYRRQLSQHTPPQEPLPSYADAPAVYGDLFVRYPRSQTPLSCYHGEVARAAAEFRMIMNEVTRRSFGPQSVRGEISPEDAMSYFERFQSWYTSLPRPLTAYYIVLPAQLGIHLHYHNVLVNILGSLSATKWSTAYIPRVTHAPAYSSPAQVIAVSKACIETLVRLYYLRHGFSGFDTTFSQFQWIMGEAAVEALASDKLTDRTYRDEALSTLILSAIGLNESGQYCFLAQGFLKVLKTRMRPEDNLLLGRYLADAASGAGVDMQAKTERHNQSNLPINPFSMKLEPDQTLKSLVYAHAEVSSGDNSDEESPTPVSN